MILSKIKKHFAIALIRIKQKNELKKIYKEHHPFLDKIYDAFFNIKKRNISNEDFKCFKECEHYRRQLLNNHTLISYDVFGIDKEASVSSICQKASSSPIWAQFMYLIIKKISSPNVLEIGTNLGISGVYILSALKKKKNSTFVTMEGLPALCEIASQQFNLIDSENKHEIRQGLYKDTIPKLTNEAKRFNIFFIDGHHQKDSTLDYFKKLKSILTMPAIMIFDDINWTDDMQSAWNVIRTDKDVCYSIDLFKLGIIIIDSIKSKNPKHFQLHLSY